MAKDRAASRAQIPTSIPNAEEENLGSSDIAQSMAAKLTVIAYRITPIPAASVPGRRAPPVSARPVSKASAIQIAK